MSTGLKIYEKQTAASRGKRVARDGSTSQSPDQKAIENRHNPGWFARPEKFINDRPTVGSFQNNNNNNKSQRGMNGSNLRRDGENNDGFTNVRDGANIFNDEDYKELVETNSSGMLRPESPYHIPEQAKPEKALMTFGPGENNQKRD